MTIWCFALIILGGWLGAQVGYISGGGAYYFGMHSPIKFTLLGLVLIYASSSYITVLNTNISQFNTITLVFGLLYLFMSLWIMSIFGMHIDEKYNWQKPRKIQLFFWSLMFGLAAGIAIFHGSRYNNNIARRFGITFLAINIFTKYCENFWNTLYKSVFFGIIGLVLFIIGWNIENILNYNI
jgi:uncharacterized membrane protein